MSRLINLAPLRKVLCLRLFSHLIRLFDVTVFLTAQECDALAAAGLCREHQRRATMRIKQWQIEIEAAWPHQSQRCNIVKFDRPMHTTLAALQR